MILQNNESWINEPLAALYEAPGVSGLDFRLVALDPTVRAGVFSQASIATITSNGSSTLPTGRGAFVLEKALCMDTPAPAPGESAVAPHPGTTTRQSVTKTVAQVSCQPCHGPMDGIGFAFEDLDPIGAHRTTENGLPIDDSGDISLDDKHQTFHGQVELMAMLAASARQGGDVGRCAVEQWYRFALGRDRDGTW